MRTQLLFWGEEKYIDPLADRYVLLEPYIENLLSDEVRNKIYSVCDSPFSSRQEEIAAYKYIQNLVLSFIDKGTKALNEFHGVCLDKHQYMIILSIYLQNSLFDLYYRYLKVKSFVSTDTYALTINPADVRKVTRNNKRMASNTYEENLILWSFIISQFHFRSNKYLRISSIGDKTKRILRKKVRQIIHRSSYISQLTQINSNSSILFFRTFFPDDIEKFIKNNSDFEIEIIEWDNACEENNKILSNYNINTERRRKLIESFFYPDNEFENIVKEWFVHFCRVSYIEAFNELYGRASYLTEKCRIKKIYTSYTGIELMDICFAIMKNKNGAIIHDIQHSGGYSGSELTHASEMHFSDIFHSWGWDGGEENFLQNERIKPLTITRIPKISVERIEKKQKILYPCNYLVIGNGGKGFDYSRYVERQLLFFSMLSREVREYIVIRLNPNDMFNRVLKNRLECLYPEIKFEDRYSIPYTISVQESLYTISDYPGSTAIESLLLGVPFVFYFAAQISTPTMKYESMLNDFHNLEIYAQSPREMSDIINYHKLDTSWLCKDSAKELYSKYLREYAGVNNDLYHGGLDEIKDAWYNEVNS